MIIRLHPNSGGLGRFGGLVALWGALFAGVLCLVVACNGGVRPTLVADAPPTPLPELELDLPPAPDFVEPLEPPPASLAGASTVDDALFAWASAENVAYADSCARVTPAAGELCDMPTERDTVRLLGPGNGEVWYVVTVREMDSFDQGTSYRVETVEIAGK